jgi:hypothetical protein
MKKLLIILPLALIACDTDRGARKDLPIDNQRLDETDAHVYLMPDQFPNIVHKCDGTTGIWVTTDRNVWITYQDLLCDGDGTGKTIDNIPGSQGVSE